MRWGLWYEPWEDGFLGGGGGRQTYLVLDLGAVVVFSIFPGTLWGGLKEKKMTFGGPLF